MSEEKAIVIKQSDLFIGPVADVQSAMVRYQAMKDFIEGVLRKDVDFGVIPGTNKPTLLKPGAEKLSTFFGLAPAFEIVEKELDWTGATHAGEPFFYFHYRCRVMRGERVAAEGEGSANSFEKKYRYRSANRKCPKCGNETIIKGKAEYGGGWLCFAKKGGCGAKFPDGDQSIEGQETGQIKNPDIADVVNTLQKMAQKRAYIAAVLLAVNGSEYFTQDLEDFDFIEGAYRVEVPEHIAQPAKPAANQPATTKTVQSEPEREPEPVSPVTNKDGIPYEDLDNDTLANMSRGISKGLRNAATTPEERAEYQRKLDAIGAILKARAKNA